MPGDGAEEEKKWVRVGNVIDKCEEYLCEGEDDGHEVTYEDFKKWTMKHMKTSERGPEYTEEMQAQVVQCFKARNDIFNFNWDTDSRKNTKENLKCRVPEHLKVGQKAVRTQRDETANEKHLKRIAELEEREAQAAADVANETQAKEKRAEEKHLKRTAEVEERKAETEKKSADAAADVEKHLKLIAEVKERRAEVKERRAEAEKKYADAAADVANETQAKENRAKNNRAKENRAPEPSAQEPSAQEQNTHGLIQNISTDLSLPPSTIPRILLQIQIVGNKRP